MAVRHIVGLDVGSKFIKAVQLTESNGQFRISDFAIAEVSPHVPIPDAIAEIFNRKSFRTKRIVSSVSGRFVFVRYISMPLMTDEELGNAARYELGKYIPVEVDEVLHDSQKLEELPPQEGQDPEMRVLLVAAKRTFIDEHVTALEGAGLQPAVVDVDSFALGNAYELVGSIHPDATAQGKLVALVDIGASKTNINIMNNAMSYFTREFYKGGDDLTEAISKKLSLEVGEAETLKRSVATAATAAPAKAGAGGGGGELEPIVVLDPSDAARGGSSEASPDLERVQDCIGGVLEDICHDINISIDYFENQYDRRVEEVFITGGASNTVGLQETLERTVQKPVSRWSPIPYMGQDLPAESQRELQSYSTQAAIALGLASRIAG